MKYQVLSIKYEAGFSTLEILVAFGVLAFGMTVAVLLAFGNQSLALDSELGNLALAMADRELEAARATARGDFYSVNSTEVATEDIYEKHLEVLDNGPCVKEVTSNVAWPADALRSQKINLKTLLVNPLGPELVGQPCSDFPPGADDWKNPTTLGSIDIGGQPATALDVINKIVYLTSDPSAAEKEDFFVIDAMDGENPVLLGSLDTSRGLNDVYAVSSGFAYVANASSTDQLLVIDISNPAAPVVAASATLPGVGNSYPEGWRIYYHDNRVYIVTRETAGNEFHIYDVSVPNAPVWLGSKELNHTTNGLAVRGDWAYLATSGANQELMILNVSDPDAISTVKEFDLQNGTKDGTALYLSGNKVYVGLERASSGNADFFIIDVTDPANPEILGRKALGLTKSIDEVRGIRILGRLAFLATTDSNNGFQIWDILDPGNITLWSDYNYSEVSSDIDFEDNLVYVANRSNDALRIIKSGP